MPPLAENKVTLGSIRFQCAVEERDCGSQTDRDRANATSDFLARVGACPKPIYRPNASVDGEIRRFSADRKRCMSRVASSPFLLAGMKLADDSSSEFECKPRSPIVKTKKARIRNSISAPALDKLGIFGGASASTVTSTKVTSQDPLANTNPQDYLCTILESVGISAATRPALSMNDFFLETTPEHIAGYGQDIINAVREEDLDAIARIRESGATLQCCNKFGESIVHMACRRGSVGVLHYLLRHGVSIRLTDDYGRTPLHDACWTQEPQFEVVKSIIQECPDLLLVTDKRGYTPLSYVRRDHWEEWCKFLEDHRELVVPRELLN